MATNMVEHIAYVSHFIVDLLFIKYLIQMNRPRSIINFEQFPDKNLFFQLPLSKFAIDSGSISRFFSSHLPPLVGP